MGLSLKVKIAKIIRIGNDITLRFYRRHDDYGPKLHVEIEAPKFLKITMEDNLRINDLRETFNARK